MKTNNEKNMVKHPDLDRFNPHSFTLKKPSFTPKVNNKLCKTGCENISLTGFTRIEQQETLALEAETKRDQGRVYSSVFPIR